jgi:hypothetical protein
VAQDIIAARDEVGFKASGAALFGVLVAHRASPIKRLIDIGADSREAIEEGLSKDSWFSDLDPNATYGNLTHGEIVDAAVSCMLRFADGNCTVDG